MYIDLEYYQLEPKSNLIDLELQVKLQSRTESVKLTYKVYGGKTQFDEDDNNNNNHHHRHLFNIETYAHEKKI